MYVVATAALAVESTCAGLAEAPAAAPLHVQLGVAIGEHELDREPAPDITARVEDARRDREAAAVAGLQIDQCLSVRGDSW